MKKLLQFPFVRFVLGTTMVAGTYITLSLVTDPLVATFANRNVRLLIYPLVWLATTAMVVAVYWLFVRTIERRSLTEFSPAGAWHVTWKGFLIMLLFSSAIFVTLWLNGNLIILATNHWRSIAPALGLAIMTATAEEILFRGLLFRLTEESLGSTLALVISSLLFGIAHYINPGATWWSSLGIGLTAGVTLSALYLLTRKLWLCIVVHATWNFVNFLLGFESGVPFKGYFTSQLIGNPLLTGGKQGIEASLLIIVLGSLTGFYLVWVAYKKKTFLPPFWLRRADSKKTIGLG